MRSEGNKMKKLLLTASLLMLATEVSAWVTKDFVPANVSKINVGISDSASDGCWTNIGEVKRYAEDKLELAGFNVTREKFEKYDDTKHFYVIINITSERAANSCYGSISTYIMKMVYDNNVYAKFVAGEAEGIFSGHKNVNQHALKFVGNFMKEIEDPQF